MRYRPVYILGSPSPGDSALACAGEDAPATAAGTAAQPNRLLIPALLFALLLQAGSAFCQQLTVQSESGKPTVLARADVEALPHLKVTATVAGASTTFEGVAVRAVLEKAGVGFGETLKGKRLTSCLLVEAAD